MTNKKMGDFEKFADFLSNDGEDAQSSPESRQRLKKTIATQLERANKISKQSWIARSQTARKEFESSIPDMISKLTKEFGSRADLVSAIQKGVLGGQAQNKFQLQFRNRSVDQLSEEDLKSIIGDQAILEQLKIFMENKKK